MYNRKISKVLSIAGTVVFMGLTGCGGSDAKSTPTPDKRTSKKSSVGRSKAAGLEEVKVPTNLNTSLSSSGIPVFPKAIPVSSTEKVEEKPEREVIGVSAPGNVVKMLPSDSPVSKLTEVARNEEEEKKDLKAEFDRRINELEAEYGDKIKKDPKSAEKLKEEFLATARKYYDEYKRLQEELARRRTDAKPEVMHTIMPVRNTEELKRTSDGQEVMYTTTVSGNNEGQIRTMMSTASSTAADKVAQLDNEKTRLENEYNQKRAEFSKAKNNEEKKKLYDEAMKLKKQYEEKNKELKKAKEEFDKQPRPEAGNANVDANGNPVQTLTSTGSASTNAMNRLNELQKEIDNLKDNLYRKAAEFNKAKSNEEKKKLSDEGQKLKKQYEEKIKELKKAKEEFEKQPRPDAGNTPSGDHSNDGQSSAPEYDKYEKDGVMYINGEPVERAENDSPGVPDDVADGYYYDKDMYPSENEPPHGPPIPHHVLDMLRMDDVDLLDENAAKVMDAVLKVQNKFDTSYEQFQALKQQVDNKVARNLVTLIRAAAKSKVDTERVNEVSAKISEHLQEVSNHYQHEISDIRHKLEEMKNPENNPMVNQVRVVLNDLKSKLEEAGIEVDPFDPNVENAGTSHEFGSPNPASHDSQNVGHTGDDFHIEKVGGDPATWGPGNQPNNQDNDNKGVMLGENPATWGPGNQPNHEDHSEESDDDNVSGPYPSDEEYHSEDMDKAGSYAPVSVDMSGMPGGVLSGTGDQAPVSVINDMPAPMENMPTGDVKATEASIPVIGMPGVSDTVPAINPVPVMPEMENDVVSTVPGINPVNEMPVMDDAVVTTVPGINPVPVMPEMENDVVSTVPGINPVPVIPEMENDVVSTVPGINPVPVIPEMDNAVDTVASMPEMDNAVDTVAGMPSEVIPLPGGDDVLTGGSSTLPSSDGSGLPGGEDALTGGSSALPGGDSSELQGGDDVLAGDNSTLPGSDSSGLLSGDDALAGGGDDDLGPSSISDMPDLTGL